MYFNTAIVLTSSFIALTSASLSPEDITKRATTCNDEGFILCPPNAPATSTGGSGSSGPYVPPYSLGPTPFQFINSLGGRKRQAPDQFCCNPRLECRILNDYKVYICLDNNTSDFFMNDGSNGNAASGMYYNAPSEANINIFTGDYVYANGTRGNGYDDTGSPRPSRDVTGSIPQATGDVVRETTASGTSSVTRAPSSSATTRGASATSVGASATSAGAARPTTTTPSSASSISPALSSYIFVISLFAVWVWR